jgi:hypothetical protein
MPYEVRPASDGDGFEVVNKESGEVKAKHATKEDAERQVRLLEGIEHGMTPTQGDGHG